MPPAFGLYMAGGYCARKDLRGITADARREAVMSLRRSSLWYTCGRVCRPRERMYADSEGTGSRTPFIQTEGAPYRMRCPSIQVRSTCILDTLDPNATPSSAAGRAPAMAAASSWEPPSHTVSSAQATVCRRPAGCVHPGVGLGHHPRPDFPHGRVVQRGKGATLPGASVKPPYRVVHGIRPAHVKAHVLHQGLVQAAQVRVIAHHPVYRIPGDVVRGPESVSDIVQDGPALTPRDPKPRLLLLLDHEAHDLAQKD